MNGIVLAIALVSQFPTGTGINIHTWGNWNDATDIALIRQAGFQYVRVDLGWAWTEPYPNTIDFRLADKLLAAAEANGIKVIFTLDYNNQIWSGSRNDKTGINTQANWEAYARWAERAARHFYGRGVIWEIWNEPNNTAFWQPSPNVRAYTIAAKLAYVAIKQYAGSSDLVIGPASTFSDKNYIDNRDPNNGLTFLNNAFSQGLLTYTDAISVHSYRPGQSSLNGRPESVFGFYTALNTLMDSYGVRKPIISGEWGYSRTEVSADTQAKFLARTFFCNAIAGVPISIWYNYTDSGNNSRNREHNFGIVGTSQPRVKWPAFEAAIAANSVINGGELRSVVPLFNGTAYLLTWSTPNGTVYVAWSIDSPKEIKVTGNYNVYNYLGQYIGKQSNGTMIVTDGVKYLKRNTQSRN